MKLKIIKKIIYPAPKKKNLEYLLSNKKKLSGMQKSWEMWPMVKKKKKKKKQQLPEFETYWKNNGWKSL